MYADATHDDSGAAGIPGAVARLAPEISVRSFVHEPTSSLTYLVYDDASRVGVVIDPVSDFGEAEGGAGGESTRRLAATIDALGIDLQYALETHVHDDHLTGLGFLGDRYGAHSVIAADVTAVQHGLSRLFGTTANLVPDGSQFDVLVRDGDVLRAGPLRIEVLAIPGPLPACVAYRIGSAVFLGDALDAHESPLRGAPCLERLRHLPPDTALFPGHERSALACALPLATASEQAPATCQTVREVAATAGSAARTRPATGPDAVQRSLTRRMATLRWNLCAGRPSAYAPTAGS
jgi:glyoxylase-like metal-dependent hydrolase (beta-lactamase superfamily II)